MTLHWPEVLGTLTSGHDLDRDTARAAMTAILEGEATSAQIAALIVALRMKGETTEELLGLVEAMLASANRLEVPEHTIDIVGTGGARRRREAALNVSTMASFVAAGAGATVCKHGNRKASSTSGSFDLLEALGVTIELDGRQVERCVAEAGIGFCFARTFHPAMRHAGPVRAELGVPTVFNFLGPLSHPGGVKRQVIGVSDPAMATRVADVLAVRGTPRAMVVHGHDGLDELALSGPSTIHQVRDGSVSIDTFDPASLGLPRVDPADLPGGDAAANAAIALRVFAGESGPASDIVCLNAAAGLVVAGLAEDLAQGLVQARESLDSGSAAGVLDRLRTVSSSV